MKLGTIQEGVSQIHTTKELHPMCALVCTTSVNVRECVYIW